MTSKHVRLFEVGPRDGLQNQPAQIATEQKLNLLMCCLSVA